MKKLIVCFVSLFLVACMSKMEYSNKQHLERLYHKKLETSCNKGQVHIEKRPFGITMHVTALHHGNENKQSQHINFNHQKPNLVSVANKMLKKACKKAMAMHS